MASLGVIFFPGVTPLYYGTALTDSVDESIDIPMI